MRSHLEYSDWITRRDDNGKTELCGAADPQHLNLFTSFNILIDKSSWVFCYDYYTTQYVNHRVYWNHVLIIKGDSATFLDWIVFGSAFFGCIG